MPEPASTVASHYAEGGEEYFEYQRTHADIAARIAAPTFVPYVAGKRVVDFGCGTGWLLKVLDAGEKLGIEPNPVARAEAERNGIPVVAATADVPDGDADVVISNHALEHSLSPHSELVELLRILKPGGRLVLRLPVDDWRTQRKLDPSDPNHHLFTWTPLLITNLLEASGFVVEKARVFTYLQPYYNEKLFPILPRPVFDVLARIFGTIKRYRQVEAIAVKPGQI